MTIVSALAVLVAGCGGASPGGDAEKYPLVERTEPKFQPPITTPSGSTVRRPVKPTAYRVDPSESCERQVATFHDGSKPTKRPIVIPPAPGLRARALSAREILLEWSLRGLPSDCKPRTALFSIVANDDPSATPTTELVDIDGASGSVRLTYPDFLAPPDVALASMSTADGVRSRTVRVLISS